MFVPWSPSDPYSYSYLLGLYLGDGCITGSGGSRQLVIVLDDAYPGIIENCWAAVQISLQGTHVGVYHRKRDHGVRVVSASALWLEAFPQHGPGRKHERRIVLAPWQREIVNAFPREFLRGLIHSDGCRTVNRFKTRLPSGRVAEYAYPRYFFSNLSEDIRGLFCEYCERLGVRWTQSNHRNISVSHRRSVARLDEFVGPKW